MTDLSVYDNDPTLYLFTSLTAGSSHIITATSRIETILKANKIPFKGVDTATDDLARKLYGRRASGKKLPLLVKEGFVLGDLEMIEEWNEYGELKEALGVDAIPAAVKPAPAASASTPAPKPETQKENVPAATSEQNLAIRQLGAEAAQVAAAKKQAPANITTTNPLLAEKVNSPAATTPKKAEPSAVLSPRSIPLPATPSATEGTSDAKDEPDTAKYNIPKPGDVKPKLPPSMHIDAANPDLNAGPVSVSHEAPKSPPIPLASPSSTSSGRSRSFHGSNVEDATPEEIKQIEKEQAIAEVSSSEEEDEDEKPNPKAQPVDAKASTPASAVTKTTKEESEEEEDDDDEDAEVEEPQKQSAKAPEKAGASVED